METLNLTFDRPDDGSGATCEFYILEKDVGLKVFGDSSIAETSRENQAIAYKYEVGPEVLSPVFKILDVGDKSVYNEPHYAFLTEICDVITWEEYQEPEEGGSAWVQQYGISQDEIDSLEQELWDAGFSGGDFHILNIGWSRSLKKMVCIDFDPYHSPYEGKEETK